MKKNIQSYCQELEEINREKELNLSLYKEQKRNADYDNALKTLEYLFYKCYDKDIEHFLPYVVVNKEYSIIYRKLKDKEKLEHYSYLSEIGGLLNFTVRDRGMLESFYFTSKFRFENEKYEKARVKYMHWYTPVCEEIRNAINEIKQEYDRDYLKYEYKSSNGLIKYLYSKNKKIQSLYSIVDNNPFDSFL